jgi:hypothetical protein
LKFIIGEIIFEQKTGGKMERRKEGKKERSGEGEKGRAGALEMELHLAGIDLCLRVQIGNTI